MPRRRQTDSEAGISLDSLMDALTNVVAVLILILVLVQADVTRKVVRFLDDLLPATPEEVAQSQSLLDQTLAKQETLARKFLEDAPDPARIEEEKQRVARLETQLQQHDNLLADLKQLEALEARIRKQRDAENAQTTKLQQEIASLEARLDQAPALPDSLPTEVTIPDSRPIPTRAVVYPAYAIGDRIHMVDPHTPLRMFADELRRNRRDWVVQTVRRDGKDVEIYDQQKIDAYFKKFNFNAPPGHKVEIIAHPERRYLALNITITAGQGGTAMNQLAERGSEFSTSVARILNNKQAVVLFQVRPDAFNTYLRARALIDRTRIPAGWEVIYDRTYRLRIPDVEVNQLRKPQPPPPNTPPQPKRPPRIDPKLD